MPCMTDAFSCHIRASYIAVGNKEYHGELCRGCPWWKDLPADIEFKAWSDRLMRRREVKSEATQGRP